MALRQQFRRRGAFSLMASQLIAGVGGADRETMDYLLDAIGGDLLDPKTLIGAVVWGVVFIGLATVLAAVVRRSARRVESRLSDVTGLRFVSAFAQVAAYLVGFVLYAHLVCPSRS